MSVSRNTAAPYAKRFLRSSTSVSSLAHIVDIDAPNGIGAQVNPAECATYVAFEVIRADLGRIARRNGE